MKKRVKNSGRVVDIPKHEADKLTFGDLEEILDTPPAKPKENALVKRQTEKRDV